MSADDASTVPERPGGEDAPTRVGSRTWSPALEREEAVRVRMIALFLVALAVGTIAAVFGLEGDPALKRMLVASLSVVVVVFSIVGFRLRKIERYDPRLLGFASAFAAIPVTLACHYFGVFSAAVVVPIVIIFLFSVSSSRFAAWVAYLGTAGVQALSTTMIAFGVFEDHGLARLEPMSEWRVMLLILLQQAIFAMVFAFAAFSRTESLGAVVEIESALRRVSQREALLQEANAALEDALKVHGRDRRGETLGRWRLGKAIGRGGMGEVYEASDPADGTRAAIKLLYPELLAQRHHAERFRREAEALSKMDNPHIVRVYDVGVPPEPAYIAMELLEGTDLAAIFRKQRQLSLDAMGEIVAQVADGLDAAREQGIVHRDLKPQNIFVCTDDERRRVCKVLDFGVSKLASSSGTLTSGHLIGTPGYMAPEQASGNEVDHRADVFSLSVVAYRGLTGRPPFSRDDRTKVLFDIVYLQPARPCSLAPLPADIDIVLAVGLAKDPDDRFDRATELARALSQAARGQLSDSIAKRGRALIERHPWGKRLH